MGRKHGACQEFAPALSFQKRRKRFWDQLGGTGQILPLHVFGHATPDRAGARPYRVQGRVARCGMGLPDHASHPLSRLFACFAGPIP